MPQVYLKYELEFIGLRHQSPEEFVVFETALRHLLDRFHPPRDARKSDVTLTLINRAGSLEQAR